MARKYVPGQIIIAFKEAALGAAPSPQPRPLKNDALLLLANVRFRFAATYFAPLLDLGIKLVPSIAAMPGPLPPAISDFVTAVHPMAVPKIPDYAISDTLQPSVRRVVRVHLPPGNVRAALEFARQFPSLVAYAEPIPLRYFLPFVDTVQQVKWSDESIGLSDEVRNNWADYKSLNIAILDSGVEMEHPAVKGAVLPATGDSGADAWGHGTAVSSVIAGRQADDGVHQPLTSGLLPSSKVLMYNVGMAGTSVAGVTFPVDFPRYMTVIADLTAKRLALAPVKALHGPDFQIRVVNMSFGGLECSITETDALRAAFDAGLHLVACAGNRDANGDDTTDVWYPAALSSVTSVSALGHDSDLWPKSKYTNPRKSGKVAVDLAAPGEHILTAWPANGTSLSTSTNVQNFRFSLFLNGSSFAAPFVTAASSVLFDKESGSTQANNVSAKSIQEKLCSGYSKDLGKAGLGYGVLFVQTLKR